MAATTERAADRTLAPGAVIGILGGGQLGRMLAMAAARLGYRTYIYCVDPDSPAFQVSDRCMAAAYDDGAALASFAAAVDVATYEFENVPATAAAAVARSTRLHPSPEVLTTCQDRILEKDFLSRIGIPTAVYAPATTRGELEAALAALGRPAVLKSVRSGYDGKGQVAIREDTDTAMAWAEMIAAAGEVVGIVEAFVDFRMEISVVVVRAGDGTTATYVPVENIHANHILKRTLAPARIDARLAAEAQLLARRIAAAIGLVGVMAVEMFVTRDDRILVNELAPRPHNSGHWTMDACYCCQFEQCVRAITGLPLGSTERHSDAVMDNLLGDEVEGWLRYLDDPRCRLHLYGKTEIRPGRKMGHVTRLLPRS
jgi:5-(carboxyamino)imidazole ribonucleotide synthase